MSDIFELFRVVFSYCTAWFTQLVSATGSQGIILAAFSLVLIISMLFMPMRGGNIVGNFGIFSNYTATKINNSQKKGKANLQWGAKNSKAGTRVKYGVVKD